MKRYVALCVAAAIILSSAGCTAVKKYEVDEEDLAYSRTLYPDGEYPEDYYEEEDLFDEEEIREDYEQTEHRSEEDKKEDKKDNKPEKKESAQESSKQSAAGSSSKPSSSNSSKSSSSSKTRTKWIKSLGAGSSSKAAKSSDTDSSKNKKTTDTDTSEKSTDSDGGTTSRYSPKKREPIYMGEFRLIDLSYNAEKDYLDFNDNEDFVRDIMGEPLEESMSEDAELKYLTYTDCVITLKRDETAGAQETEEGEEENADEEQEEKKDRFFLVNILVPYESYYETFKFISTSFHASKVIEAYGEPTEIVADDKWYDDEEDITPRIDDMPIPDPMPGEEEQQTDSDIASDEEQAESEEASADPGEDSSEPSSVAESEPEPEPQKPFTGDYLYKKGSKALIFHIENDEIMQIEYRWDR